jgi:hypothetical protein
MPEQTSLLVCFSSTVIIFYLIEKRNPKCPISREFFLKINVGCHCYSLLLKGRDVLRIFPFVFCILNKENTNIFSLIKSNLKLNRDKVLHTQARGIMPNGIN